MARRCGISPPGQLRLTEEARIGLGLPLSLWFGDCSPADARLDQHLRQRIDFLAHFKRKEDAAGGAGHGNERTYEDVFLEAAE